MYFYKIVVNSETLQVLDSVRSGYTGPADLCCGASGEEKSAFSNEKKVSQLLTSTFQQFAGTDKNILDNLVSTLTPIAEAGPGQFGMSPAEQAALRSSSAETLAAAGRNATNATRGALASIGGGMSEVPSGSEAAIIGDLAQSEAVTAAEAQNAITEKGYDLGRANWEFATSGLASAPGALENPVTAAGNAANSGAQAEMSGGQAITQANQAWMAPVAGIIGAVAGGATGGLTKMIPRPGGGPPSGTPSGASDGAWTQGGS